MGGRDHSCESCGRGGFNAPTGRCECQTRRNEPAKKNARLADGYCARCARTVMPFSIEYAYDHPEHYDGVSEYSCSRCGRREGRWTGTVLAGGASEPRLGEERDEKIAEEQARFPEGSQPR